MKLSFYNKRMHPSAFRLLGHTAGYLSVLIFIFMLGLMQLAFVYDSLMRRPGDDILIGPIAMISSWLAGLCTWRKERKAGQNSVWRLIIGAALFILPMLYIFNNYRREETLLGFCFLFVPVVWFWLWPRESKPFLVKEHDNSIITVSTFLKDTAKFEFVSIIALVAIILPIAGYEVPFREMVHNINRDSFIKFVSREYWAISILLSLGWLTFWHKEAFGDRIRIIRTAACVAAAFAVAMCFQGSMVFHDFELCKIPPIIMFVLIYILTAIAWRRNNKSSVMYRAERIRETKFDYIVYCAVCHYNLSGITKLRCPECGTEYSIGRLVEQNVYLRSPDLWLN